MRFPYQEYCDQELGAFMIQLVILVAIFLYNLPTLLRPRIFREKVAKLHRKIKEEPFFMICGIFLHCGFVILLVVSLILNLTSGICSLFYEKEEDALVAYGTVEAGESCTKVYYPIYDTAFGSCTGQYIYISGTRYYIMNATGICVGDKVKIMYLPESKYILHYDIVESVVQREKTVASNSRNPLSYIFMFFGILIFIYFWCRRALEIFGKTYDNMQYGRRR